ncbi:DUF7344 domain-containing protein [Haladaptatus sp. DFWS20]|uniref:DUF7344 domain-containing protein n=1 Tax=Haladaptatus sp. DFWS20 TaxID=3403467 RepID=UPI003EBA1040
MANHIEAAVAPYHRRVLLAQVRDHGSLSLSELTEAMVREIASTEQCQLETVNKKRVRARLYHIDIPLFADLGLLLYDKKSQWVSPTAALYSLNPTLLSIG